MSTASFGISVSLDGYLAGPDAGRAFPMGRGGERLHDWIIASRSWRELHGLDASGEETESDDFVREMLEDKGAVIMGRRMFDCGEEPWGDNPPYHMPVYVVTHRPHEPIVKEGGTTYFFVTDGPESAMRQARATAEDKGVSIAGGGDIVQQLLAAGLVDEFVVNVVPVFLGAGHRLFDQIGEHIELEPLRVVNMPAVTHLKYRVKQ